MVEVGADPFQATVGHTTQSFEHLADTFIVELELCSGSDESVSLPLGGSLNEGFCEFPRAFMHVQMRPIEATKKARKETLHHWLFCTSLTGAVI